MALLVQEVPGGHPISGRRHRRLEAPRSARSLPQTTIRRRDAAVGWAHALTFYGFVVLFIGTVILAIEDNVAKPLGLGLLAWPFYLGYSLFLDVFGAALTAGVLLFALKRIRKPPRFDYRRVDDREAAYDRRKYVIGDWTFLASLLFLAVTGFLLEATRIAVDNPSFEHWAPFGWALAQGLRSAGISAAAAADTHLTLWWLHGISALAFVAAIPFTKALHVLVDPVALITRDELLPGVRLPASQAGEDRSPGYGVITDLSPKHLVGLDSCTKCGNCHVVCPATASGLPLSPRDLILDLREHAEGALGARRALRIEPVSDVQTELADVIPSETVWSCMQCLACVDACPVGIEHVPIIVDLRRHRVDTDELDETLQTTLEAIYESGNSFGLPRRRRARWVEELPFTPKDARAEPVDVLWFVGDYASLDPRNQHATRALASTLTSAGVDFGILYEAERTRW